MLVLSRKLDQSIVIGENVTIKVVRISGNTVKLAIDAPRSVPITRTELLDIAPAANPVANVDPTTAAANGSESVSSVPSRQVVATQDSLF